MTTETEQRAPEQRTPEWFAARKGRVTASVAGAILGVAPYMTRADALRMMVRETVGAPREFTGNVATEYGTRNEQGAVFDFQLETGLRVQPAPFETFEDWLGASPDGLVNDGGLIEVKCPFGLRDKPKPVAFKPIGPNEGEQPHYYAQIQVQLYVTQSLHCWFYQWTTNDTSLTKVMPDPAWLQENLPRLRQFHAEYLDEVANNADERLAPKRPKIDTPEAARMVAEWDDIAEQLALLADRKADLLADMTTLAGGKNALLAGRKLTLTERAGSVAYAKVVKEHCKGLDLEPYRGKPSQFWQVR